MTVALALFAVCLVGEFSFARAENASPLPEALEAIRKRHAMPGLAAASVRDGKIVEIGACGVRKLGAADSVQPEDRWHIGSCTKSMTASVAAMLVADGKIKWDTTVADVFPELREKMNAPWRDVTLSQLLTHRGGAPGDAPPALWKQAGERLGTPTQQRFVFTRGLLSLQPEAAPGTKFIYSNQGYSIAGAMLEKITGKPWEELMRARLFAPLGMETAGFGAPASVGKIDAPWGHAGEKFEPVPPGPGADNPPVIGPGGTVHCSIRDLVRYAGWHARKGPELLDAAGFAALHTPPAGGDYAMGWSTAERSWAGGMALTHNGTNTMFYAVMWVAPEKGTAFVAATNAAGNAAAQACDEAVAMLIGRL